MTKKETKPSTGRRIAVSVLPFIHIRSHEKCTKIIALPVDRAINELVDELKKTEDLLINLVNEGRPVEKRLERVRKLIKAYQ